jgi:hypothetical protein
MIYQEPKKSYFNVCFLFSSMQAISPAEEIRCSVPCCSAGSTLSHLRVLPFPLLTTSHLSQGATCGVSITSLLHFTNTTVQLPTHLTSLHHSSHPPHTQNHISQSTLTLPSKLSNHIRSNSYSPNKNIHQQAPPPIYQPFCHPPPPRLATVWRPPSPQLFWSFLNREGLEST